MSKQNNKWFEIGTLRKKDDGNPYIVLNSKVQILVDGQEVDLGQYRKLTLTDPMKGYTTMLENGRMDKEEFEKQQAFVEEKAVRYRISVAPQND